MSDQQELAPENVVTSVTWNMSPTVEYVIDQVLARARTPPRTSRTSRWSPRAAPRWPRSTPTSSVACRTTSSAQVEEREAAIKAGTFRVDINETTPPGSTVPDA